MKNDIWYDYFIETLYERYPHRNQLAQALMDLLIIEREAVYRRLRKDVIFPAHEIIKIASAWNISLDEFTGINSGQISFFMQPVDYIDPTEEDLTRLQQMVQFLNRLQDTSDSEYMEIGNKLSRSLIAGYEHLNRFYLFKWMYQYGGDDNVSFSRINVSDEKLRVTEEYYQAMKNVATVNYIWDHMIFDYLVCDIQYFHSIQLLTDEEKNLVRKDLYALLDYMSEVAAKGTFPETNNKVNLYISQINIDTNYSYMYTQKMKVGRVHAFGKYEIYTIDSEMIENFKIWMHLKKRSSAQISEVDEKRRIEYFMKQRQLIDSL